jgi:cytochrome c-type biogenesis protein CcmH/NrfG
MKKKGAFSIVLAVASVLSAAVAMPGPAYGQTDKGVELYNSWEYLEAEKVLREAVRDDPQDVKANFYLGLSLLLQQKHGEALDFLMKARGVRAKGRQDPVPGECQIEIALARARLGLQQYQEAWENLEAARKLDPRNADVYVYRGVYYHQQGKEKAAIKELEKAIRLDDHNVYAHYYAGHVYLRLGNPARAVDMFRIFLNLAPNAPEAPKAKALMDALC